MSEDRRKRRKLLILMLLVVVASLGGGFGLGSQLLARVATQTATVTLTSPPTVITTIVTRTGPITTVAVKPPFVFTSPDTFVQFPDLPATPQQYWFKVLDLRDERELTVQVRNTIFRIRDTGATCTNSPDRMYFVPCSYAVTVLFPNGLTAELANSVERTEATTLDGLTFAGRGVAIVNGEAVVAQILTIAYGNITSTYLMAQQ